MAKEKTQDVIDEVDDFFQVEEISTGGKDIFNIPELDIDGELESGVLERYGDQLTDEEKEKLQKAVGKSSSGASAGTNKNENADDEEEKEETELQKRARLAAAKEAAASAGGDEDDDDEEEEEDEEEDEDGVSPFVSKKTPKEKDFDYKQISNKNFTKVVGKRLGMNLESDKGLQKLAMNIDKMRVASQNLPVVQKELDGFKELLTALPVEMKAAIRAFATGNQNWRDELNNTYTLDVSKDFGKMSDEEKMVVVAHFYGKESYKNLEEVPEAVLKNSHKLFNNEKSLVEARVQQETRDASQFEKNYAASLDASIESFRSAYPDFDDRQLTSLKSQLKNGGFRGLFLDDDGLVKPDAIKNLAFAKFGESYVEVLAGKKRSKQKSDATADNVSKQQRTPVRKRSPRREAAALPSEAVELLNFKKRTQRGASNL